MRMTPTDRRAALEQMPTNHYSRRMFFLSLKVTAAAHEGLTAEQQRRFDTELQPAVRRIQTIQQRSNMRGLLAIYIDRANTIFDDIMGTEWHPRPDNPIQRQCQTELLVSL